MPVISVSLEVKHALRSVAKPGQRIDDVLREMLDMPERRVIVAGPLLPVGTLEIGQGMRLSGEKASEIKRACRMCKPRTFKVSQMLGYYLVTRLT